MSFASFVCFQISGATAGVGKLGSVDNPYGCTWMIFLFRFSLWKVGVIPIGARGASARVPVSAYDMVLPFGG